MTCMWRESPLYHVVRYDEKKIMALPAHRGTGLSLTAIRRYQSGTFKKGLVCLLARIATVFHLIPLLCETTPAPLRGEVEITFPAWLESVCRLLDVPNLAACVIWPSEQSRGRAYVHLLTPDGCPAAFAKVSLSEENDDRLLVESETLRFLNGLRHKSYRVPMLIEGTKFEGRRYLLVEAIPTTAKPYKAKWTSFPWEASREYGMGITQRSSAEIRCTDWWQRFVGSVDLKGAFFPEVSRIVDAGQVKTCRVNGDLGPANMFRDGHRPWIVDWERSCPDGPQLTDFVSFYLGSNRRRVLRHPDRMLNELFGLLPTLPCEATRSDVTMALAFLHAADFKLAARMMDVYCQ